MNSQNSKEFFYEYGLREYDKGKLDKAIVYYRKSITKAHMEEPADQLFVFEKSIELAHIYVEFNKPECALPYANQAYDIFQNHTLEVSSSNEYAVFIELLGNLSFYLEHFDKAVVCYTHAECLYHDINNKNLAKAKKSLAQSHCGEISVAIKELQSILAIDSLDIEIKNKTRKYLADIMAATGQYQEALNNYQIIFNELNENHEILTYWLLETLFAKATANFELGNFGIAMNQYKQVVSEIALKKFPGSYRLKIQTLLMIAKICIIIRDTSEAIRLLDSVDENSLFEPDRIYYQLIRAQLELRNLNSDLEGSSNYLDIISSYQIGEISNDIEAEILLLQSNIHFHNGDILKAIEILHKLIDYYQDTRDVYQVSVYKLHLCQVLMNSGTGYQKSEIISYINDVETLISNETGEVLSIKNQVQIANLYCRLEEYALAYETLKQIYKHEWDIIKSFVLSGDKEQVFFQDIIDILLNITLATANQLSEKKDELQQQYLNLHIKLKSLFLLNSRVFRELISKSDLPEINLILRYNQKMKEMNSRTFSKSEDYHRLKMEVNSLEIEIKENTDYFKTIIDLIKIRWEDIKLDTNEAAISFSRYEHLDENKPDRSGYSGFIILSNRTHPVFIDLGICDDFLKEILPFNLVRNFEPGGSFELDVEVPLLGELSRLYSKIFKPLESALKGIQKIYFTVDGLLNYVPFNALLDEENKFLMDKFDLIQLQNLRDIKGREAEINIKSIAIFGGIDFGRYCEETDGGNTEKDNTLSALRQISKAEYENKEISELFSGKNYPKFMPDLLDLTTFRNISQEKMPSCIHILTHGFFFNDEQKKYNFDDVIEYNTSDIRSHPNPLLRSGIFTSDYNRFVNKTEVKSNEKGVITSYDISRSQLGNTFLVTIHACESALGAVRSGETYGLARAFRLAGAQCVILTLWKIQYTKFYIYFYRHLLNNDGKDVRAAYNKAIYEIRKDLPNPYWWSGFVLIE
jgi:CHAT domain-containing protein